MNRHLTPDACVACTTCLVQCPVSKVSSEFLGPRLIGPAWERFRLMGMPEDDSLHFCANCKNCDISCPQGVAVSHINVQARIDQCKNAGFRPRDWMLAHGDVIASLLRYFPAVLKNFGMNNGITRSCLDTLGIARKATLPAFAVSSFMQLFKKVQQPRAQRQVVFFPGCYTNNYDPQTGLDLVWILNRAGYEVVVPDTVCCGLPLLANGYADDARQRAQKNLALLAPFRDKGVPIITTCPSCALTFNTDLEEFFPDVTAQWGSCFMGDAQAFVLQSVEAGDLDIAAQSCSSSSVRLAYHAPCHLRASGHGLPGFELLRRIPGCDVCNTNAGCCGQSGSYGFKKEHYDIAQAVGAPLFEALRHSGARMAVSECGTCRIQIKHGSGLECAHPLHIFRAHLEGKTPCSGN